MIECENCSDKVYLDKSELYQEILDLLLEEKSAVVFALQDKVLEFGDTDQIANVKKLAEINDEIKTVESLLKATL